MSNTHRRESLNEFKEPINIGPIEVFTEHDGSFDLFKGFMKPYNDDGSNPEEVGICTTMVDRSFSVTVNGHEFMDLSFLM